SHLAGLHRLLKLVRIKTEYRLLDDRASRCCLRARCVIGPWRVRTQRTLPERTSVHLQHSSYQHQYGDGDFLHCRELPFCAASSIWRNCSCCSSPSDTTSSNRDFSGPTSIVSVTGSETTCSTA